MAYGCRQHHVRVALEVHFALAQQADGVALEIQLVEIDVFALDVEVDVALAEGVGVGGFDAENLEHGDHHRQLVDVGVAEVQVAVAAQGSAVVAEAVQFRAPKIRPRRLRLLPASSRAHAARSASTRVARTL